MTAGHLRRRKEPLEPSEELGLPGEAASVPPPRHPQVAMLEPPHIGRRIPRLERADGDDVLVERAETVTGGWHNENSRKYWAVSR
jgi:hypothetical protein